MIETAEALGSVEPTNTETAELDRREVLGIGSWLKAGAALGGVAMLASACDAVGDSGNPDMLLMKRATFGVTGNIIDRLAAIGAGAWLAEQLDWTTLDTSAVDAKVAMLPAIAMTPTELQINYPDNDIADAAIQLAVATAIRQTESPAQVYERMVDFWSDHLNVPLADQTLRLLKVVEDREAIRPHALGKFKDLLVASAQSPAMLYYLDNAFSSDGAINENYARELLELHTVGVNGGYDEADVVATAELFTGWSIDPATGLFSFKLAQHDPSFQSILGWDRPADTNYLDHGVQFLHHLATHPNTATFICTKLTRRFVNDSPDPALIADLAAVYSANDTDIKAVLQALFAHPTFLSSGGQKLKRPQEYLVGISRQLGAAITPVTTAAELGGLAAVAVRLGQPPFLWPAPNGYPDVASAWLNTGGLLARWNAAADVAHNTFPVLIYDVDVIRAGIGPSAIGDMLDTIADRVLHEPLTDAGRFVIADYLAEDLATVKDAIWLFFTIRPIISLMLATNDNQFT